MSDDQILDLVEEVAKLNFNIAVLEKESEPLIRLGLIDPTGVRNTHVGSSDYSSRVIQPWSIWVDWNLNPWDADIVKRIGRTKSDASMTTTEQRILDYEKIQHIAAERIRQLKGTP